MTAPASNLKWMRRVVRFVLVLGVIAIGWFAWMLGMAHGYFEGVHWRTADGGLELDYMPGKPHMVGLRIHESYSADTKRVWIKDFPDGTERWIGRVPAPSPEELLASSGIERAVSIGFDKSALSSVCQYFSRTNEHQRVNIRWQIEDMLEEGEIEPDVRACLEAAFRAGDESAVNE